MVNVSTGDSDGDAPGSLGWTMQCTPSGHKIPWSTWGLIIGLVLALILVLVTFFQLRPLLPYLCWSDSYQGTVKMRKRMLGEPREGVVSAVVTDIEGFSSACVCRDDGGGKKCVCRDDGNGISYLIGPGNK